VTVNATVDNVEKNVATLTVEISGDYASQEYNKACRRLGQRINISGFRRGKAPRAVIEKNLGAERIQQEALDKILPPVFADVISENQLDAVAPPRITEMDFDLDKGINLKASLELRPEVKLPNIDKLKVDIEEFVHPDGVMDKELASIQERYTTLEPVIDRVAEATDTVNIDFTGKVDGKPIEGGSAKSYQLDLADNHFIEGFADQIVGHKLSEEFTIKVTFPKEYHDDTIAGKDAEFDIKLNEIKAKVKPDINDDLAKKAGDFETLDQLKEAIQKGLDNMADQENLFRKQKAIVDALIDGADVTLSETMVDRETSYLAEEVKQRLSQQGLKWEQFIQMQGKDEVMANIRRDAANRVQTSLIFGQIAKEKELAVTADEFSAQIAELAKMANVDEKTILRQLANNPTSTQGMNDQLLSQKVMDMMITTTEFNVTGKTHKLASQGEEDEHVHGPDCNHDHDEEVPAEAKASAESVTGEAVDEKKEEVAAK
jgi:trigger factor